eukprot:1421280-Prymnesium_polylepis.1
MRAIRCTVGCGLRAAAYITSVHSSRSKVKVLRTPHPQTAEPGQRSAHSGLRTPLRAPPRIGCDAAPAMREAEARRPNPKGGLNDVIRKPSSPAGDRDPVGSGRDPVSTVAAPAGVAPRGAQGDSRATQSHS